MARTTAPPPRAPYPRSGRPSPVREALAADRIDAKRLLGLVLSLVAPLTVAAGVIVAAFAVTGERSIPLAFGVVAAALALVMPGYLAMTRYVQHTAPFAAFNAQGLGRPVGVAGGLCAVVAYGLLLVGLFGAFGATIADDAQGTALGGIPWWGWAALAALVVGGLGLTGVRITATILAMFGAAEIVVVLVLAGYGFARPTSGYVDLSALNPTAVTLTAAGVGIAIAVTGLTGGEVGPAFVRETKNPHRTVCAATYTCLGIMAVLYTVIGVAMIAAYGNGVVDAARQQGPAMLFGLGPAALGVAARLLYATSLFAAMTAFHLTTVRYLFGLGRDRVLPASWGRTNLAGVPRMASIAATGATIAVIAVSAAGGLDPVTRLFYLGGTTGAIGVLGLLTVTSASVYRYLRRPGSRPAEQEPFYRRALLPVVGGVVLAVMTAAASVHFAAVAGVPEDSLTAWAPAAYPLVALAGGAWAWRLRRTRPEVYAGIGHSADDVSPARRLRRELDGKVGTW